MGVLCVKPVCLIAARHPSGSSFKMTYAVPAAFFRCEQLACRIGFVIMVQISPLLAVVARHPA